MDSQCALDASQRAAGLTGPPRVLWGTLHSLSGTWAPAQDVLSPPEARLSVGTSEPPMPLFPRPSALPPPQARAPKPRTAALSCSNAFRAAAVPDPLPPQ